MDGIREPGLASTFGVLNSQRNNSLIEGFRNADYHPKSADQICSRVSELSRIATYLMKEIEARQGTLAVRFGEVLVRELCSAMLFGALIILVLGVIFFTNRTIHEDEWSV